MTELRPDCPFCGAHASDVWEEERNWARWTAGCDQCGCKTGNRSTKGEAIAAWNMRAEQTKPE